MPTTTQFLIGFAAVLCLGITGVAQENKPVSERGTASAITAFASSDRVRFAAPSSVVQIRLEVYNSAGLKLFDNEVRGGNVLDWHLGDGQAERVADDTYLCVVTVKGLSGRITQRIGSVTVDKGTALVNAIDISQMTGRQAEATGPIEENVSLVVLKEGERQTPTVVAHNGEEGQIVRGRGALSFRIGDFFSGKDKEQMRLTTEGNLGIGITHPTVRLEVDGLIRSSEGIVFPDGTIQYSASSRTLGAKSTMPDQMPNEKQDVQPQAAGTGTQNQIAKWTDNAGTLGDSVISESGGNIGVGTSAPAKRLHVAGGQIALDNQRFLYSRRTNNQFQEAFGIDSNNDIVFNRNSMVTGQDADAPKAPSALIFGTGAGKFLDVRNSGNVTMLRVDESTGNVGIGVTNPDTKLDIHGTVASDNGVALKLFNSNASNFNRWYLGTGGAVVAADAFSIGDTSNYKITFLSNGNVGIGTTDPAYKLAVEGGDTPAVRGDSNSSYGVYGRSSNFIGVFGDSNSFQGVHGSSNSGTGVWAWSGSGNLIVGANGSGNKFRVENNGTVHAPAYLGLPDFAEEILPSPADKSRLEPGDVLVAASDTDRSVSRSRKSYSTSVLGVYSTAPGFIGTENPLEGALSETIPMAVIGIVPCKVSAENGRIKRGDLLTTSRTPGHAMRCANPRRCSGAVVGKALAALERGTGVIKVLVSLQ